MTLGYLVSLPWFRPFESLPNDIQDGGLLSSATVAEKKALAMMQDITITKRTFALHMKLCDPEGQGHGVLFNHRTSKADKALVTTAGKIEM